MYDHSLSGMRTTSNDGSSGHDYLRHSYKLNFDMISVLQSGVMAESETQWRRENHHVFFAKQLRVELYGASSGFKSAGKFCHVVSSEWANCIFLACSKVVLPKQEEVQAPRAHPVNGTALKNRTPLRPHSSQGRSIRLLDFVSITSIIC
jgi:hypothetical protein